MSGHRARRLLAAVLLAAALGACAHDDLPRSDWPVYLGAGSNHYSDLALITRENVRQLKVAWVYHSGEADEAGNRTQIEASPIVVDGVLYGVSPLSKIFALDAATGKRRWEFDPAVSGTDARRVTRGVTYWSEGSDRRILAAAGSKLFALDARNGRLIRSFGHGGVVDLHDGLDAGRDVANLFVISTTPGVIYRNLLILPTRVTETSSAAPGNVRAFDVKTGAVAWVFHTIPHPGEPGYDTWPPDAWRSAGGANDWAGMTVDQERGLVFVPTGSAAPDYTGRDRPGANLFANTLLVLDAATGKRVWHFQIVHHDLWDRDLPAPPNLFTIEQHGVRRDVVAQITKSAHVFVFDRQTGEPVFPIEERPVPRSDVPGEVTWPTQPIPTRPPPFARQRLTENEVTDISPEARRYVLDRLRRARTEGPYAYPSRRGTILMPGVNGGGEWGGAGVDPRTGIMYVNANDIPFMGAMVEVPRRTHGLLAGYGLTVYARNCVQCHGVNGAGDELGVYPRIDNLAGRLPPAATRQIIEEGRGFMPSHAQLSERERSALIAYLYHSDERDTLAARRANDTLETGREDGTPAGSEWVFAGYFRFVDQAQHPASRPPWATLNAIDLNAGEILWKVPLGDSPALSGAGRPPTGAEGYGGPLVTGSGLIFIGASSDERIRAFDARNGTVLWETGLPAAGYATPITYMVGGRQYVVIAAGGGKLGTRSGDEYIAFALP